MWNAVVSHLHRVQQCSSKGNMSVSDDISMIETIRRAADQYVIEKHQVR